MIEATLADLRKSSTFFKTNQVIHIINGRKKEEIGYFVPNFLKDKFEVFMRDLEKEEKIKQISEYSLRKEEIKVDLNEQKIIFGNNEIDFNLDTFKKKCLIEGLDDIALSLEKSEKIVSFEKKLKISKPWIFYD